MQKRAVHLYVWGRKRLRMPSKLLKDCAKSSGDTKSWCPLHPRGPFFFFNTSFGSTHTHTHIEKHVSIITALLVAASSFPQRGERKGEKDPALPSETQVVFLYSGNHVCSPCDSSEVKVTSSKSSSPARVEALHVFTHCSERAEDVRDLSVWPS